MQVPRPLSNLVLLCIVLTHVQLLADQPLTASRRRQQQLNFLQAKLEAEDEQLLLEGARVGGSALATDGAHLNSCTGPAGAVPTLVKQHLPIA